MRRGNCGAVIGVCALGLGLGILIAAIFPVGALMFLVAFLLIACGIVCLKDNHEDRDLESAPVSAGPAAADVRHPGITRCSPA